MSLRVFVASKFEARAEVRELHDLLRARGMTPTATWCDAALEKGPADWFEELEPTKIQEIIATNDRDLRGSHAVFMLAHDAGGRESYAEVARAIEIYMPVVWTGPTRCLSCYRSGVFRTTDTMHAIRLLESVHKAIGRSFPMQDDWAREAAWRFLHAGVAA